MSWILLLIAIAYWVGFISQLSVILAMISKGNVKSFEVSSWQILFRSVLIVVPFYISHWPTLY